MRGRFRRCEKNGALAKLAIALHWQCRDHRFESGKLHQKNRHSNGVPIFIRSAISWTGKDKIRQPCFSRLPDFLLILVEKVRIKIVYRVDGVILRPNRLGRNKGSAVLVKCMIVHILRHVRKGCGGKSLYLGGIAYIG